MSKRLATLLFTGALALLFNLLVLLKADTPATGAATTAGEDPSPLQVADFRLRDTSGRNVALADFAGKKALVVVFIGTECPISNGSLPRLAELDRQFTPRGVQFLAINSNCQDTAQRVAEHAAKHGLPFPVLKDEDSKVADLFGARRTPEAFLLDRQKQVRYRGRIDDQFGAGYKRSQPAHHDLAEALEQVLAGQPVRQPRTSVVGCFIGRATEEKRDGIIAFARDVAPILQKHCQECHRPGQIGPMTLLTYENARAWAPTIREVVDDRRMPPWYADPHFGTFENDRRLSDAERSTLLSWIDQGTPRGKGPDLPPRSFTTHWTIGEPDLVLTMPEAFAVPAEMPKNGIPYQNIFVDPGFREDRWVTRAEVRPGAPEVVHHIVIFVIPPGKRFFPGSPETPAIAGTAPGDSALILPPGTGKKIPAGSRLLFQMHYTPNGRAQKDQSSLALTFAKTLPVHRVLTQPVANIGFRIPPGDDNLKVESWFRFKEDSHILAMMPHMHLRGKDFLYEAVYPDGRTETLLSVPRWNFNWQGTYRLVEPHAMPKGSRIHCIAHFDNSANNPNNPDPSKTVRWGDQSWEEMMIGWMDYVEDSTQAHGLQPVGLTRN